MTTDERTVRYWTGSEWTDERVWNGNEWVGTTGFGTAPVARGLRTAASPTYLILCGGAAAAVLGSLMPWIQVTQSFLGLDVTQTAKLTGVGVLYVLLMGVGVAWLGYPALTGGLSAGRRIGLTAVAATMPLLLAVSLTYQASQVPDGELAPGVGMVFFVVGTIAVGIGVMRTWFAGSRVGG
jgi:hypothetical protein